MRGTGGTPDSATSQRFRADSAISPRQRSAIAGQHGQAGESDGTYATGFPLLLCRVRCPVDRRSPASGHHFSGKRPELFGRKRAEISAGARAGASEAPRPPLVVGAHFGAYLFLVLPGELAVLARIFTSAGRSL